MRMTRIMAILALVLATNSGLSAQDSASTPRQKKIRGSLLGGATFTTLSGSAADTAGLSTRSGLMGSLGVEFALSRSFGLQLEGSLIQKGAKQPTVTNRPGLGYNLIYLEVPLLLKWNLAPSAKWQPVLLAGPSVAFEMDCKMPFLYVTSVINSACYSNTHELETTDVGGQVGAELHKGMFFLTGRYMMGFTNKLKGDGAPGLKNSGFIAGLGITF